MTALRPFLTVLHLLATNQLPFVLRRKAGNSHLCIQSEDVASGRSRYTHCHSPAVINAGQARTDVAVNMAINVQPKVQRHHCPRVRSRSHAQGMHARARTHTHTADNGFLDSVAVRRRDARRGEKGRAAEAGMQL